MIFAKKEVIELEQGKKYIIVDTINEDNVWYYYICEVNDEENEVMDNYRIITTITEHGNFFIKSVKGSKLETLEKMFKEKLQID